MSTATQPTVAVTCSESGAKLIFRGPYSEAANAFYHSLPAARWHASDKVWTCDSTPAAAWRVLNELPAHVGADDAVLELSFRFTESLATRDEISEVQPPLRVCDSWPHQAAAYNFVCALWGPPPCQ